MRQPHRGDPREETTRYNKDFSWTDEVAEIATAIQEDYPITNGSAEDALKNMELVYRIYCADSDWKAKWGLSHVSVSRNN